MSNVQAAASSEPLTDQRPGGPPSPPSPGGSAEPDPYPIQALLCCASCEQSLFGTRLPDGTRVYRGRCGCRLHWLDAGQLERRVYAEAQRLAFGPDDAMTVGDYLAPLAFIAFARVRVGATVDDLSFIPHI